MTDSRFLASSLFALSLFAVPGVDLPNVGIDGLSLASGAELKTGGCNEVHVFVRAAPTFQGSARVQLVLREADGDLVFSGTRTIALHPGEKDSVTFDAIPIRGSGRHVLSASALAGDMSEMQVGFDVGGTCVA
jgi:hypothetical protein